ncbi:3-phosphoshikimate 1-carboxyvinyltransferase, partial [Francisella tularensis subsp. holarctica]|nr:3-phosphoshikimate 1-carboxyvinyltransferase [Francisella tularensis subsp. holarctica]
DIDENIYTANKSQYISTSNYVVEQDVSTASYFWAFAAIPGSTIKVMHVTKNSKQGYIKFLEVLEKIGCQVNYYNDG